MNRITTKLSSLFFAAIAAVCSSVSLANPIGFIDLGTSTVDTNTGLEWLDLTRTVNRGVGDIITELSSGTGLGIEGWRYATINDFNSMANNFFQLSLPTDFDESSPGDWFSYICEPRSGTGGDYYWYDSDSCPDAQATPVDTSLIPSFIDLFGATHTESYLAGAIGYLSPHGFDSAYPSNGFYQPYAFVYDRFDDGFDDVENGRDWIDCPGYSEIACWDLSTKYPTIGSYLVREASVPEPSALILLGLGLAGFGLRRLKDIY